MEKKSPNTTINSKDHRLTQSLFLSPVLILYDQILDYISKTSILFTAVLMGALNIAFNAYPHFYEFVPAAVIISALVFFITVITSVLFVSARSEKTNTYKEIPSILVQITFFSFVSLIFSLISGVFYLKTGDPNEAIAVVVVEKLKKEGFMTEREFIARTEAKLAKLELRLIKSDISEHRFLENKILELRLALSSEVSIREKYKETIANLEVRIASLEEHRGDLPDHILDKAINAYRGGDDETANHIFDQIIEREEGSIKVIATAYFQKGMIAEDQIRYKEALKFYVRSTELSPDNTSYLRKAGLIYYNLSHYEKSIEYFNRALTVEKSAVPKNSSNMALNLQVLGVAWGKLGKHNKAINYYSEALAIYKSIDPPNNKGIADTTGDIGAQWYALGKYKKAIYFSEQALSIRKKNKNTDIDLNNLGMAWSALEENDKALHYYERALSTQKANLVSNHPDIAKTMHNIGNIWSKKENSNKAMNHFNKSLAIMEDIFPENHPDIAASFQALGGEWKKRGEFDTALDYFNKSLAILEEVFPENHPNTASILVSIATTWLKKGNYDKAIHYLERARSIEKEVFSKNHPDEARTLSNLGIAWHNKRKFNLAINYHQEALNICRQTLPKDHPLIKTISKILRESQKSKKVQDKAIHKFQEAEKLYKKTMKMMERELGSNHPKTISTRKEFEIIMRDAKKKIY